jgi:hypothetical protein
MEVIMGESKRRREKTIGEDMGLRSGEPMVLKFFSGRDILDLGLKFSFQGLDEEALEKLSALQAVAARATSDSPAHCLICRDVVMYPALIGYARTASKSRIGAVMIVCRPCSAAAETEDDLRASIVEALGEVELKTSNWAS